MEQHCYNIENSICIQRRMKESLLFTFRLGILSRSLLLVVLHNVYRKLNIQKSDLWHGFAAHLTFMVTKTS